MVGLCPTVGKFLDQKFPSQIKTILRNTRTLLQRIRSFGTNHRKLIDVVKNARTVLNFIIVYDDFLFRQLLSKKSIPSTKVVEEKFTSTKVVKGILLSRKTVDDYFGRKSSRTKRLVDII